MRELIKDVGRMYILSEDETGSLLLEVVVGGIAMECVAFRLNDEEAAQYRSEGKPFVDELGYDVCKESSKYRRRTLSPEG